MIVAFWNRLKSADAGRQAEWLAGGCELCPAWDVLLLAEVSERAASVFDDRLGDDASVASWVATGSPGRRPHGIMVVARSTSIGNVRFPSATAEVKELPAELEAELVRRVEDVNVRPPLPERWLAADMDVAGRIVAIAGAQLPYAAGRNLADTARNRLAKREAYRQLADWAKAEQDAGRAVVLGLDGNNWHDWIEGASEPDVTLKKYRDPYRRLLDEARLFDCEADFHSRTPSHGLADALRSASVAGASVDRHCNRMLAARFGHPLGTTHLLANDGPRMDRIYVSPDISVRSAGICHGALGPEQVPTLIKHGEPICCGSDHALVWADLDL